MVLCLVGSEKRVRTFGRRGEKVVIDFFCGGTNNKKEMKKTFKTHTESMIDFQVQFYCRKNFFIS